MPKPQLQDVFGAARATMPKGDFTMPIEGLLVWGVAQAAGALVKPGLEDFAKDVINDSAKDYVKRCFGNVFTAAHQDALQKALGQALAQLLK